MSGNTTILDIVTVNEKGQIVIPADARAIANISAGDKLLVMLMPSKEGIILTKPKSLEAYAKNILSQVSSVRNNKKTNK